MSVLLKGCEMIFPFTLECTIAVTVLMAVAWLAIRLLPDSPALRHRILASALLVSLVVPAVLLLGRPYAPSMAGVFRQAPAVLELQDYGDQSALDSGTVGVTAIADSKRGTVGVSPSLFGPASGLVCIWFGGCLYYSGTLICSCLHMSEVRRASMEITDPETCKLAQEFAQSLGLIRPISLRCSQSIRVPMAVGATSPCVLFPIGFAQWSKERLELAICHELTHIARRDVAAQIVAEMSMAVYWFHPLVRFAERATRLDRELACDDSLITSGWKSSDYATHLVDVARNLSTGTLPRLAVAMASSRNLETRVRHLLRNDADRRPVSRWAFTLLVSGAAVLLAGIAIGTPTLATEKASGETSSVESAGPAEEKTLDEAVVFVMHPAEMHMSNAVQQYAASQALGALNGAARCGILTYGKNGTQWLWEKPELVHVGKQRDKLLASVFASRTGDFPDFQPAFEMAFSALQKADTPKRRVLVLTDGDPAPPSKEILAQFKAAGIPVTVVHADIHNLGNRGMAQKIAARTGGKYYHIRNANAKIVGAIFRREVSGKVSKQAGSADATSLDTLSKPADLYIPISE